jgi:PAS domain S-box-containing protein
VQLTALYFALRLVKVTAKRLAWGFISSAIALMALRSGLSLAQIFNTGFARQPELTVEIVILAVSVLMAFGIERIAPVFALRGATAYRPDEDEARYHLIFENSPIPIREEDYSKVKERLDELRREGIEEIGDYLDKHPEALRQWAEQVRVVEVNRAALRLHGAKSKMELLTGLTKTHTPESLQSFRQLLICLWRGDAEMRCDTLVKTLAGGPLQVMVEYAVCPGYEETLSKIFVSLIDITERKHAEQELIESETMYRRIILTAKEGILVLDVQGEATFFNAHLADMLGYSMDELRGRRVTDFMLSEDIGDHRVKLDKRKRNQAETYERRLIRKDGTFLWVLVSATPIFEDDRYQGVFSMVTDITERKQAELKLQQALEFTEGIINAIPDILIEVDAAGRYLNIWTRSPELLMAPKEALLGKTVDEVLPTGAAAVAMAAIHEANEKGLSFGSIYRLDLESGSHWFELSLAKMPTEDPIAEPRFLVLSRDVTERMRMEEKLRASEQRFRAIFDQSFQFIGLLSNDGSVLATNAAALDFAGIEENEVIGKPFWETPWWSHSADLRQRLRVAINEASEGRFVRFEATHPDKEGDIHYIDFSLKPVTDSGGRVIQLIPEGRDITDKKLREDELRRYRDHLEEEVRERTKELRLARDAAEAANKAKSVFLANMSHELRTPLNAILGFSHMMQHDTSLSAEQHETLDIINSSGEHLFKLINDVLEITKIEAGKLQLEIAPFDLHAQVREVSDMMRLRAQQKGLKLELDQASEFPRYIKGDEARLRQILVNLLSNAVKFTMQGRVTLRLRIKENTRHHLVIEVEDSGPGISTEDQQRLFKPFVQLREGATQGGTGLGLSIVSQFVQMMGGSVVVESKPGLGSLFRVDLPLEAVDEAEITHLTNEQRGEVVSLAQGQPVYRILIAEDQRDNQLLLARLMTELGMEVKIADNGEECVRLFQQWHPDLIWIDRRMPEVDGVEATRRIRQLPGGDKVKIVAVTATVFKEQQADLQAVGMDDMIRKPFRFSEIYDSMQRQLGVEFIYSEEAAATAKPSTARLTPRRLAEIEPALRLELQTAVESLDSARIGAVIGRIGKIDAGLAGTLQRMVSDFDYPSILELLKKDSHNS